MALIISEWSDEIIEEGQDYIKYKGKYFKDEKEFGLFLYKNELTDDVLYSFLTDDRNFDVVERIAEIMVEDCEESEYGTVPVEGEE